MIPPRAGRFSIGDLDRLDDEALSTFLDPADEGVPPALLGLALRGRPDLAARVEALLPAVARGELKAAMLAPARPEAVVRAEREVVGHLFWPLLYWHDPDAYVELTAGEELPPALIDALPLHRSVVADLGAGAGRFTLEAARRARRVIAVDAVPALLERLSARAAAAGLDNVETRRGGFRRLPLDDASVDVAVFCSSFHSRGPHGGEGALREAERVVRRGGTIAVIWPESAGWLLARGFSLVRSAGDRAVRFPDPSVAELICREFYGEAAATWVRRHRAAEVPPQVLRQPAVDLACIRPVS